jgi:hypothetical protein
MKSSFIRRVVTVLVAAGAAVVAMSSSALAGLPLETVSDLRLKKRIRLAGAPLPPTRSRLARQQTASR